jgi:hypothetical protein
MLMQVNVSPTPAVSTLGVIEWAPFVLADGVDEATLLAASEALQREFLSQQPGFVRRELLRGADGQWVDLVHWASQEAAEAVMQNVAGSPACHRYFSLMAGADTNEPGAGVLHLAQVAQY